MNRRWAFPFAWLVGVVLFALSPTPTATAQHVGGQRYAPASSEDGILGTEGADVRVPMRPYVSLWGHYAFRPVVRVEGNTNDDLVRHLAGADLAGSLTVWRGLELGLGLPVNLYFDGDDEGIEARGADLGDVTLRIGYRLRLADRTALALHVPVLLPTTVSDDGELLSLGLGARPTVAFMQGFGRVTLLLNVSYLVRGNETALDYQGGQELGASLGSRIALDEVWRTNLLAQVGFSTAVRDFFGKPVTPVEGRVGLEHWLNDNWRVSGFGGMGFTEGVGAPDFRVGVGIAYGTYVPYRPRPAPASGDRDGDGVLDAQDGCPDEPEDPDGFEDEDGCPELDNDKDGISDIDDGCPNAPETKNGISDDDGCPDQIRLEDTLITTFEPVRFRTNSDEILPQSHEMLREVAAVMKANPDIRIRVEGHTDSQGNDAANLDLSQRRADSVREFLIDEGIGRGRLEALGHGETRPVASNDTKSGRAKNRRVEFHILRGP